MNTVIMELKFIMKIEDTRDLDVIAETGMKAVVDAMPLRSIVGTGYDYSYDSKKTKRGMHIKSQKKTA